MSQDNLSQYDKVIIKRFSLSDREWRSMNWYTNKFLLNKPYPNKYDIILNTHKKDSLLALYCSQIPWLAYRATKGWDIDSDGGYIVYPVDILNTSYGESYALAD